MRLSKPVSVFVLVVTLVPWVYFVFFMGTMFWAVLSDGKSEGPPNWFPLIFVLHMLCMLWIWALIAFYIVYLFKSPTVPSDQKALWAVVLFFANMFAMPVFWYLYIWREFQGTESNPPQNV